LTSLRCGGFVGREDEGSEVRVWADSSMRSSGLSMARSLGDSGFKVGAKKINK
jgi:hypothetical protein